MACYGQPVDLLSEGELIIPSEEGVQQGDPCGPLFFAVLLAALTKKLSGTPGVWSQWFLDDGYLVGSRATSDAVLPLLESEARMLGLELNRANAPSSAHRKCVTSPCLRSPGYHARWQMAAWESCGAL